MPAGERIFAFPVVTSRCARTRLPAIEEAEAVRMAPTNRLIEARRAELRAEDDAGKQRDTKSPAVAKRQGAAAKTRQKPKN
jgi:hypothetical protein